MTNIDLAELVQRLEKCLCGECAKNTGAVECHDCHELYCHDCFHAIHRKGRRKFHSRFHLVQLCNVCDTTPADCFCTTCKEHFCPTCREEVHSRPRVKKAHHEFVPIDPSALKLVSHDTCNAFGFLTAHLTPARFSDADPSLLEASEENERLVAELAKGKRYVDTLCTLRPNSPQDSLIIDVGTSDGAVDQLRADVAAIHTAVQMKQDEFASVADGFYSWRRTVDISHQPAIFCEDKEAVRYVQPALLEGNPQFMPYLPSFRAGVLNDHCFTLAVASVATHRDCFSYLFADLQHYGKGMVVFQFYDACTKRWVPYRVDDLIPCGRDLTAATGRTGLADEYWLALLQKAYATMRGGYGYVHRNDVIPVLRHMTAGQPCLAWWPVTQSSEGGPDADVEAVVWFYLTQITRWHLFAVCGNSAALRPIDPFGNVVDHEATGVPVGQFETTDRNAPPQFAWNSGDVVICGATVPLYDITGAPMPLAPQRRVVKLRCGGPVDAAEPWTGEWSDYSGMWTKETRHALGHNQLDDRVMWMGLADFARRYNTLVHVANYHGALQQVFFGEQRPMPREVEALHLPQYLLEVAINDNADGSAGEAEAHAEIDFRSVMDLKPSKFSEVCPEEYETDDEDNMSLSTSRASSMGESQNVTASRSSTLRLRVTLSHAVTAQLEEVEMAVYRVPTPGRLEAVETKSAAGSLFSYPPHNRVELSDPVPSAEHPGSVLYDLMVPPGAYSIVVRSTRQLVKSLHYCIAVECTTPADQFHWSLGPV